MKSPTQLSQFTPFVPNERISWKSIALSLSVGAVVGGVLVHDRNISLSCVFPDGSDYHHFMEAFYPNSICFASYSKGLGSEKKREMSVIQKNDQEVEKWHLIRNKGKGKEPIWSDSVVEVWVTETMGVYLFVNLITKEVALIEIDGERHRVLDSAKFISSEKKSPN